MKDDCLRLPADFAESADTTERATLRLEFDVDGRSTLLVALVGVVATCDSGAGAGLVTLTA